MGIARFGLHVGNLNRLLSRGRASERRSGAGMEHRVAPPLVNKGRGCAVQRNNSKRISLASKYQPKIGIADARGVGEHGLEDRFECVGRARDHAQDIGGRGLLLQSLVEFLFQVRVGCAKAFNRLRSGRTKTTNAGLALRPLARQGHLVGTVTGPFRVGGPPAPGMEAAILTEPTGNSRGLIIQSPRRRGRAAMVALRGRALSRS